MDVVYLDATFYDGSELPGRDMLEIPHPLMIDTMQRLQNHATEFRGSIRFIHLNHTTPAHDPRSAAAKSIRAAGFRGAVQGERVEL